MKEQLIGGTGIYVITNTVNDKKYIGSSIDIRKRVSQHIRGLKNNKHSNRHLQNHYNKYGNCFIFSILELCNKDELLNKEQHWINLITPAFNCNFIAERNSEGKRTKEFCDKQRDRMSGRVLSKKTRKKMREARIGIKHTDETKAKLSKCNKYTRKIKNIKTNIIHNSITEASIIDKISQSTIYRGLKDGRYEYI